jgi:hypothetical protein
MKCPASNFTLVRRRTEIANRYAREKEMMLSVRARRDSNCPKMENHVKKFTHVKLLMGAVPTNAGKLVRKPNVRARKIMLWKKMERHVREFVHWEVRKCAIEHVPVTKRTQMVAPNCVVLIPASVQKDTP